MPGFFRLLVAPVALAVLVAACTGDDDGGRAGGPGPTGPDGRPIYAFTVTGVDMAAMSSTVPPFPADLRESVTAALNAYLGTAVVDPFLTGQPASRLEAAFTAAAVGRLAAPGPERSAALEEGAPLAGKVHQDRANANLTALAGPNGEIVLVTAAIDVGHTVDTGDSQVDVSRTGELVLVAEGGAWRIDAFDLRTARGTR